MPIIGRPEAASKYSGISMRAGESEQRSSSSSRGETSGMSEESVKDAVSRLGVGEKKAEIFKDAKSHNKMGKDEFLKLLSFQMQNQDPMNPMDQSKFAGELAQFSQLEQLTNMRTAIEASHKNDSIEEKYLAASFLGKRVLTEGGSIDFKNDGRSIDLNFSLEEKAKNVMVRVIDQKGGMMAEIRAENLQGGNHQLRWDGTQFDGYMATPGKYSFQVLAFDEVNRPVKAVTKASGLVSAVTFENGEAVLSVDGKKVPLKSVDKIELPKDEIKANFDAAGVPVAAAGTRPVPTQTQAPIRNVGQNQVAKAYEAQNENLVDYSR